MVGDVLKETPPRLDCVDVSLDVWPEMAWIVGPPLLPCDAKRLARIAANDAVHPTMKGSAWERGDIRVNRCCIQGTFFHLANQAVDRVRFDLHVTDCASVWKCQLDAEIEASGSAAQAEDVVGM
jgi:hypothetical protein